jgi:hypothetical protein
MSREITYENKKMCYVKAMAHDKATYYNKASKGCHCVIVIIRGYVH